MTTDPRHNGGPPIVEDIPDDIDRQGWVTLHRSIRDHWLVGFGIPVAPCDPDRGSHSHSEAFQDLIMECRYKAGWVSNGGRRMKLEPGQLMGAISWLANRWNWTPKKVRWFLDKLESEGMISRNHQYTKGEIEGSTEQISAKLRKGNQGGNQAAVITICNYLKYQLGSRPQDQSIGQSRGNQGAIEGQSKGNNLTKEQGNKDSMGWGGAPGDGFEHVGLGVYVNCDSVWHPKFTINLKGVQMQTFGNEPMERIKNMAVGKALEWAEAASRNIHNAIPANPDSVVRGALQTVKNNDAIAEARIVKAAASARPGPTRQSQKTDWGSVLDEIEGDAKR